MATIVNESQSTGTIANETEASLTLWADSLKTWSDSLSFWALSSFPLTNESQSTGTIANEAQS